jgi:predicted ribosome quality control (RQC) complex YloA/Tae2 family protein
MPMDGVTLGFIARELADSLIGGRVDKVTQPERDEINILIRCRGANRMLLLSASAGCARAHLTASKKTSPLEPPMLCMLMRKHLIGSRVAGVRQIGGDRILEIDFEGRDELGDQATKTLVCEFMGKHSNIMLLGAGGRILECARRVTAEISRVREVLPGLQYVRPPSQGKLPYDSLTADELLLRLKDCAGALHKALGLIVSGIAPATARELAFRAAGDEEARLDQIDLAAAARRIAGVLQALPSMAKSAILLAEDGTALDLVAFPFESREHLEKQRFDTLSQAMDAFFEARDLADRIRQKSSALHRVLGNNIERCEKKLALQLEALEGSRKMEQYRIMGELITASAHMISRGSKTASLPNYYDEAMQNIDIPLDERLSPAQNAQRYFKLYQKARSARLLAAEQIKKTREELSYLEGQMENLRKCETEAELGEIREELERLQYVRANHNRRQMKKLPPSQPLHYLSSEGRDILIGKNNLQNDQLTHSARANEVWLHAKDIPGSHVIIVGEAPGEQTLREAALLAAYYSKSAGSSNVPVDYTLRRYVKKPGGAKPGFVTYTHQRTLFVTPGEEAIAQIKRV